jgi:hypothetical protein
MHHMCYYIKSLYEERHREIFHEVSSGPPASGHFSLFAVREDGEEVVLVSGLLDA